MPLKSVFIGEISDHSVQGVRSFEKRNLWSCSFFPRDSPSLMFGSISSAIYMTEDGYSLLSFCVVTTDPLRNGSLGCRRDSPPFSAKWIFRKQRCTPMVFDVSPFRAKQNISAVSGLVLFMLCQYRDDGCQESPFICLSGFVGNHLKTDHTSMRLCLWST